MQNHDELVLIWRLTTRSPNLIHEPHYPEWEREDWELILGHRSKLIVPKGTSRACSFYQRTHPSILTQTLTSSQQVYIYHLVPTKVFCLNLLSRSLFWRTHSVPLFLFRRSTHRGPGYRLSVSDRQLYSVEGLAKPCFAGYWYFYWYWRRYSVSRSCSAAHSAIVNVSFLHCVHR